MVAPVDSELLNASLGAQQLKAKTKQLTALKKGGEAGDAKLREAVEGFEAIFIQKCGSRCETRFRKAVCSRVVRRRCGRGCLIRNYL